MRKGAMSNILQRGFIFCCVMLMAMTVVFTRGKEAKARYGKEDGCSLQSITLEIDGKEHKFEGDLEPFMVEKDQDWATFLSTIKIVDFEVVSDDICTCEGGHNSLEGNLLSDAIIKSNFITYEGGTSANVLTEEEHGVNIDGSLGYFRVHFITEWGYMEIYFVKEYSLNYALEGGAFPEGIEVPNTYYSYVYSDLPIPEREGYIFKGWTFTEDDTPEIKKGLYGMTGDFTCTAHWTEGERKDISSLFVEMYDEETSYMYRGEAITPEIMGVYYLEGDERVYLTEGTDYTVSYKNNIEIAAADSENPPTIIIKGMVAYTGTKECTFSITKAEVYYDDYNISGVEGSALSTVDLSLMDVWVEVNDDAFSGTWQWSNPNDTLKNIEDRGYSVHEATFTPTDTEHYEVLTTDIVVRLGTSISDWEILFVDEDSFVYTGKECYPEVRVMNGEMQMEEWEDYVVTYVNNVNAGDKTDAEAPAVVIQGIGEYAGTKKLAFTIEKATPSIDTAPVASAIEEGKKLSDSVLSGGKVLNIKSKVLEGEFSWKDGTVVPALADSGVTKYTVVFTPSDTNYEEIETTVVVTVNKKVEASTPAPTPTPDPEPTPTPDPEPTPDPTPTPAPQPTITVGDKMADKDNKATYQVTKSEEGKVEVSYVAPTSKKKTVSIPVTVTLADGSTAKVTSISAKAFKGNKKIETVTISKNVKTIGKEAFSGCKNLKKVKSATNVTSIGKSAFANCSKLTSVAMGSKVTTIGEKAFYKCTKLAKITIPKNVKSIGKSSFQGCKKLKSITIKTTKLTKKNVKKNAFKGIPSTAKINVPNKKVKAYKSMLRSRGVSKKATIK